MSSWTTPLPVLPNVSMAYTSPSCRATPESTKIKLSEVKLKVLFSFFLQRLVFFLLFRNSDIALESRAVSKLIKMWGNQEVLASILVASPPLTMGTVFPACILYWPMEWPFRFRMGFTVTQEKTKCKFSPVLKWKYSVCVHTHTPAQKNQQRRDSVVDLYLRIMPWI